MVSVGLRGDACLLIVLEVVGSAMSESIARETFIPFKASDVIELCLEDEPSRLSETEVRAFRSLARMLSSVFHHECHQRIERLKETYAPFDPDADTRPLNPLTETGMEQARKDLFQGLTDVLEKANYHPLTRDELKAALANSSLFKIRLDVDFDDFEDVVFFVRGERRREETVKKFFRKKTIQFDLYERVAIYVRFKDHAYFEGQERDDLDFTPASTVLKLFRNVPKGDLEILFPNVKVKMRGIDKLLIGVPALIGGVAMLVTKLLSVILLVLAMFLFWMGMGKEPVIDAKALIAAGVALGTAGGYVLKQIGSFKNRKIRFLKALSDQLYFKNLDNNAGVIYRLISGAEEEELKEAILAYYFLMSEGSPMTTQALDRRIEEWFVKRLDWRLDFDVEDGLAKLERLGLAITKDGAWSVVPLAEANQCLDARWDSYFDFSEPAVCS